MASLVGRGKPPFEFRDLGLRGTAGLGLRTMRCQHRISDLALFAEPGQKLPARRVEQAQRLAVRAELKAENLREARQLAGAPLHRDGLVGPRPH